MPANLTDPGQVATATGQSQSLEDRAHQLAQNQPVSAGPGVQPGLLESLQGLERLLRAAYRTYAQAPEAELAVSVAAEWILDNFYVVEQALRQVRQDLPTSYYRQLPVLTDFTLAGYPRIYAIAWELIREGSAHLDLEQVKRFIKAYQQVTPLTMGELWALPIMLRLGILETLAQVLLRLTGQPDEVGWTPAAAVTIASDVAAEDIVANSILSLRRLNTEDWPDFFESISQVEQVLRDDPAQVYSRMDFESRDGYRKVVEELALATGQSEIEVARTVLRLAQASPGQTNGRMPSRSSHVGYYLLDAGRATLEERLGYTPAGHVHLRRWLFNHPTLVYLGSISLLTLVGVALLIWYGLVTGGSAGHLPGIALLALIPALTVAVSLANWLVTHLAPPRVLPKLDFKEGIPLECSSMVVIPSLIATPADVEPLLRQLELHFLSNPAPHLYFALLTDFTDAPEQHLPGDQALIERATAGIQALNEKYSRPDGGPFYLFHRQRVWNPAEGVWMGWERKRGKLHEFNRLLRGDRQTSYTVRAGPLHPLPAIRYVITLDGDTLLPQGAAARLIGALTHPLNRAEFDARTGAVVAGYTLLQPRTEITPASANHSLFTRIFAGDTGLDLYTLAVSDVYQDLFGEGSYVGKGIYDLDAFERSLAGRVPENTLLSHDLFEGIHGRAGLATDIVLYEDYPPNYLVHIHRAHRWIRGDWQLLPWLLPRIPRAGGGTRPNDLSAIDRWKILDNLRRSLLAPTLLALFIAGWLWLPGSAAWWTLAGLLTLAAPLAPYTMLGFVRGLGQLAPRETLSSLLNSTVRWLLALAFVPYEAVLALNAILITLGRLLFTRRHLLQWTTASDTVRLLGRDVRPELTWRKMISALLLALILGLLVGLLNPAALPAALPLLGLWAISPGIANLISQPRPRLVESLSAAQERQLRYLARRTWLFFERFIGPEDNWLPPDHFQENPRGLPAHRTSPTNIGLMLLSTLAAYDLGYMGMVGMVLRFQATFETLDKLEKYRGHLLNWYDTGSLAPLPPRYVSTVDSGNLAACLLALRQACFDILRRPVFRPQRWQGLVDTLGILSEALEELTSPEVKDQLIPLQTYLAQLGQAAEAGQVEPGQWPALLTRLVTENWPELNRLLLPLLGGEASSLNAEAVRTVRVYLERIQHHLQNMQRDLDMLMPWLDFLNRPPDLLAQPLADPDLAAAWQELVEALPAAPRSNEVSEVYRAAQARLAEVRRRLQAAPGVTPEALQAAMAWCDGLDEALNNARLAVGPLLIGYEEIAGRAEAYVQAMDFNFLFDPQRQVFHIGYNVTASRLDDNYYDLLASEARVASLIAIAKADVPVSHWLHLSRPLTRVNGARALLSWSGTMFEYLMPALLMRSYEETLLHQSNLAAVDAQIAYGRQHGVPWGISEAGYYGFDTAQNYQYRAFGVPGLGFKRGLEEDLVIAPYASLIALSLRPQAVLANLAALVDQGLLGRYGLYESVDYTPSRLALGQEKGIVRSFMAHHQGMIMLALANYLQEEAIIRYFQADPRVQSVELLWQEQLPTGAPLEFPHQTDVSDVRPALPVPTSEPWPVPLEAPFPPAHYLSNGRYGLLITSAGSGYSTWQELALTRWRTDTTQDDWGTWLYVQDRDSGVFWSLGYQPTGTSPDHYQVLFYPHQAEFQRSDDGIVQRLEITVAPNDDLEIRRVTLTNGSGRPRRLRLVSYGEVVLAPPLTDARHPAFNKLFIESEYLPNLNSLLFRRRPRSAQEEPLYLAHVLVVEPTQVRTGLYESDRARFLGRGRSARDPLAFQPDGPGLTGTIGATLDPVMALGQDIDLPAHSSVQVTYLTLVTRSRPAALALAERYQSWAAIERAFTQARSQNELEMRQLDLVAAELTRFQRLLSLLLYPHPARRADPAMLAANTRGQSSLWGYAISGDYPILLVRINNEDETALVLELLQAHAYWRQRQLKIDLVILNQRETGYAQAVQGRLHRLLAHTHSDGWLNQRGGIFLLRNDQLTEADRVLLNTVARVILDGASGSLAEQVASLYQLPAYLPPLVPARPGVEDPEATPPLARPNGLLFDNGLGGFSPDGREYIIYLEPGQWTPAPWINVIANPVLGCLVSEAGGGYTWAVNSGENRLTGWANDPVSDPPGEALYLRDEETGQIWSPTPLPVRAPAPYLVRHGAGYSIFEHNSHGLKQRLRIFVAPDAPVKVIGLRLENTWSHIRRVTATFYAPWVLATFREQAQQFVIPEYDAESHTLLARNPYNVEFGERVAFVTTNKSPHGLTADRTEFLGRYGDLMHPAALARIGLAGTVRPGLDPCAAVQLHLDLPPGQAEEVFFLIGQGADREEALRLARDYQAGDQVEAAWQAVGALWDNLLGTVTVQTPDPAMDLLLNRWLLYQDLACRVWGRSALYQSSGAYGFRDQLQDVLALLHAAPGVAREQILRAARHQFEAGDVLHWWHPPSGRGVRTRISDDLLWLPFVAAHYVNTTGDMSIMTEKIPFLKGPPLEQDEEERYGHYETTTEGDTLYEHCRRAIQKGATAGSHQLPLMGAGDWNDGMNRVGSEGQGESVWLGWFLVAVLDHFAAVSEQMGYNEQAESYRRRAEEYRQALAIATWDGEWYLRAFYDDGTPLGSAQNRECQIDAIAQSWAVLSGGGELERVEQAMASVDRRLVRYEEKLVLLFTPPFDKTSRDPGYIKGYLPGIRENGGQYTHAATWTIWAFAELGQGDRAEALFRLINPIYHADTPEKADHYKVEPYVIAADVYGSPPHTGRGGWTWYTGSGGWMYRLGLEAILGLNRVGSTLRLKPCIPQHWPKYEISYRYGNTCYRIQVDNSAGVNRGVKQVSLDGQRLDGEGIPLVDDGRDHTIRIVMG